LVANYGNFLEELENIVLNSEVMVEEGTSTRENETLEKIINYRIEAMGFTVPEQFKEKHLKLVLSFSLMEEYYETKVLAKKDYAVQQFEEVQNYFSDL